MRKANLLTRVAAVLFSVALMFMPAKSAEGAQTFFCAQGCTFSCWWGDHYAVCSSIATYCRPWSCGFYGLGGCAGSYPFTCYDADQ